MDPNDFRYHERLARPSFRVTGPNQTLLDNTATDVIFDQTEDFDSWSMHSTSSNPEQVTIPISGIWFFYTNVSFGAGTSGRRSVTITKNAANTTIVTRIDSAEIVSINAAGIVECAKGDVMRVSALQVSTGNLDILNTRFAGYLVSIR